MTQSAPRVPFIAGNWKMNLDHLQAIANVQKLAWSLKDAAHDYEEVEVGVFPPYTDIRSVQTLVHADKIPIKLGAQDLSQHAQGAFTGEISGAFLSKLGVQYVIVGHSERRAHHGEDDSIVAAKARAALEHGLIPIICVGETAEDLQEHGAAAVPQSQLTTVLETLPKEATYIVAYEPVWAIGSGQAATPEQAAEVASALRQLIHGQRGPEEASHTRILYGGSVSSNNVASFLRHRDVDGVLVGGASLDPVEFSRIAQFRKHVTAG